MAKQAQRVNGHSQGHNKHGKQQQHGASGGKHGAGGVPSGPVYDVKLYMTRASRLHAADLNGKSDPYCRAYLREGAKGRDSLLFTSETIKKTLNPDWSKSAKASSYVYQGKVGPSTTLLFKLFDYDKHSSDDSLGTAKITSLELQRLVNTAHRELEVQVLRKKKSKGSLFFTVEYVKQIAVVGGAYGAPHPAQGAYVAPHPSQGAYGAPHPAPGTYAPPAAQGAYVVAPMPGQYGAPPQGQHQGGGAYGAPPQQHGASHIAPHQGYAPPAQGGYAQTNVPSPTILNLGNPPPGVPFEYLQLPWIPNTVADFKGMRDNLARSPEGGVAMLVVAMIVYTHDQAMGTKLLTMACHKQFIVQDTHNIGINGSVLSSSALSDFKERILGSGKDCIPRSYLVGTKPNRNYKLPQPPFLIRFKGNDPVNKYPYRRKMMVYCSGALPRPVVVEVNDKGIWKAQGWNSLQVGVKRGQPLAGGAKAYGSDNL